MANKKFNITRANALFALITIANGFDSDVVETPAGEFALADVMAMANHMLNQLGKPSNKKKSDERICNESDAIRIVDILKKSDERVIGTKFVQANTDGAMSPQRASSILRTAVDMGLLVQRPNMRKDGTPAASGPKRYVLAD